MSRTLKNGVSPGHTTTEDHSNVQKIHLRYSVAGADGVLRVWRQEELGIAKDAVVVPDLSMGNASGADARLVSPSGRVFSTSQPQNDHSGAVLSPVSKRFFASAADTEHSQALDETGYGNSGTPSMRRGDGITQHAQRDNTPTSRRVLQATPTHIAAKQPAFSAETLGVDPNIRFSLPSAGFPVRRVHRGDTPATAAFLSSPSKRRSASPVNTHSSADSDHDGHDMSGSSGGRISTPSSTGNKVASASSAAPDEIVISTPSAIKPLPPVSQRTRQATTPLNITVKDISPRLSLTPSQMAERQRKQALVSPLTAADALATPLPRPSFEESPEDSKQAAEENDDDEKNPSRKRSRDEPSTPELKSNLSEAFKRVQLSPKRSEERDTPTNSGALPPLPSPSTNLAVHPESASTRKPSRSRSRSKTARDDTLPPALNLESGSETEADNEVYVGATFEEILAERTKTTHGNSGSTASTPSQDDAQMTISQLPLTRSISATSSHNHNPPASPWPASSAGADSGRIRSSITATPQSILKKPTLSSAMKAPGSATKELTWGPTLSQVKFIPSSSRSTKRSIARIRAGESDADDGGDIKADHPILKRVDFGPDTMEDSDNDDESESRDRVAQLRSATPYHARTGPRVTYSHSSDSSFSSVSTQVRVPTPKPGEFREDPFSRSYQYGSIGPDDKNTEPALLPLRTFRVDEPSVSLVVAAALAQGINVDDESTNIFALQPRTAKRTPKPKKSDGGSGYQSSSSGSSSSGLLSKLSYSISSMFTWGSGQSMDDSGSKKPADAPSTPTASRIATPPERRGASTSSRYAEEAAAQLQMSAHDVKDVSRILAFDDAEEDSSDDDDLDLKAKRVQVISNEESNEVERTVLRQQGSFFSLNPEVYESQWSSASESEFEDDEDDDDDDDDDADDESLEILEVGPQGSAPIVQTISLTTGRPLPTIKDSEFGTARTLIRSIAHRLTMAKALGIRPKFMTFFRRWPMSIFKELGALTIGELARWRWFHLANEIVRAHAKFGPSTLLKHALPMPLLAEIDESAHDVPLEDVLDKQVTIFTELSGARARMLEETLRITSVRSLATFRPTLHAFALAQQAHREGVDLTRVKPYPFAVRRVPKMTAPMKFMSSGAQGKVSMPVTKTGDGDESLEDEPNEKDALSSSEAHSESEADVEQESQRQPTRRKNKKTATAKVDGQSTKKPTTTAKGGSKSKEPTTVSTEAAAEATSATKTTMRRRGRSASVSAQDTAEPVEQTQRNQSHTSEATPSAAIRGRGARRTTQLKKIAEEEALTSELESESEAVSEKKAQTSKTTRAGAKGSATGRSRKSSTEESEDVSPTPNVSGEAPTSKQTTSKKSTAATGSRTRAKKAAAAEETVAEAATHTTRRRATRSTR